jgi:hypothetical protein
VSALSAFGLPGGVRGSRPAMISPRNFGSQTFSAVCLTVIGSVAPRAMANFHDGGPPELASLRVLF